MASSKNQKLVKLNFENELLRPNFVIDFEFVIENKITRVIDEKFETGFFETFQNAI